MGLPPPFLSPTLYHALPWKSNQKEVVAIENNGKKMGRPIKSDEPRTVSLHLRISNGDANRINRCAKTLELSRTDTIMRGISELEKIIEKE